MSKKKQTVTVDQPTIYTAVVGVENGETGKRFNAGATVTLYDFPDKVIATWLKQGILKPKPKGGE